MSVFFEKSLKKTFFDVPQLEHFTLNLLADLFWAITKSI